MIADDPTLPFAVVLKGYPRLSETFIAQELLALQDRGHRFQIWSLRQPYDGGRTHAIHDRITAPCHYLPEYLYEAPQRLIRAWMTARRMPGYTKARTAWLRDLGRDLTPNRGRRWGQALILAAELPAEIGFLYAHFLHTPASVARYAAMIRGHGWGFSAHAKDIWTIPNWEKAEKIEASAFGVTCTGLGAQHLSQMDPTKKKISLVYHGLDLTRFPDPPPPRTPDGTLRLVSVGRLVEKKGYDVLLEALAQLPDALTWRLDHIGGGALTETLQGQAEALGLSERITWHGKQAQDSVIAALRRSDLFVLPSRIAGDGDRDGLPNVLMEAASQRLPILSTAISAIPEFIEDGTHGALVAPDDAGALAKAIADLGTDWPRRQRYADAAFDRLRSAFDAKPGIDLLDGKLRAAMTASAATAASAPRLNARF